MKLRNFDDFILEELQDQEFASTYLQDALEEGGIPLFLIALKQVLQAKKESGLTQEIIDYELSETAIPDIITIDKLLNLLGMKIKITTQ